MNFSLERVFVVPSNNTLPTTGTSGTLAANQFGVFLPAMTPATTGNVGAADYSLLVQQRPNSDLNLPTIKSDKIYPGKVIKKYKVAASAGQVKIATLDGFDVSCDETMSVSIRVYEEDLLMSFANGYSKTYTKAAPCCGCDDDPCASVDPSVIQTMVEEISAEINKDAILKKLLVASTTGTGATTKLVLTGKVQTEPATGDRTVNQYRSNAVNFQAWAYKGAPTTQDAIDFDGCDSIGTFTVTQELEYAQGTPAQVALSEYKHFSYIVPQFKERFSDVNYNGIYHSNVDNTVTYDMLVIQFHNPESVNTWSQAVNQDSKVIIWSPTTKTAAIEAILTAKYGTFPTV